jgi:hypothetical protein
MAHYTSHGGMCLSYSSEKILAAFGDEVSLARVSYADQPVKILKSDIDDDRAAAYKILSQKKASWAYEQEWRLLSIIDGHKLRHRPRSLKAIYLGIKVLQEFKDEIYSIARTMSIPTYEMEIDDYYMLARSYPRKRRGWIKP